MDRRSFIKAFSATAIALPFAKDLAGTPDSESVIETFISIPKSEDNFRKINNQLFLAYDHNSYIHFMLNNKIFSKVTSRYINSANCLLGRKRGTEILAIGDWWKNTSDEIMEIIQIRSLIIKPVFADSFI